MGTWDQGMADGSATLMIRSSAARDNVHHQRLFQSCIRAAKYTCNCGHALDSTVTQDMVAQLSDQRKSRRLHALCLAAVRKDVLIGMSFKVKTIRNEPGHRHTVCLIINDYYEQRRQTGRALSNQGNAKIVYGGVRVAT